MGGEGLANKFGQKGQNVPGLKKKFRGSTKFGYCFQTMNLLYVWETAIFLQIYICIPSIDETVSVAG